MKKINKTIKAWWPKGPQPGNLGDIVTPLILQEMFGYTCQYQFKPYPRQTLMGAGSILSHAQETSVVWGSGAMRVTDPVNRGARYLSVRGPRTREIIKSKGVECPEIYGDPALLLPEIFNPDREVSFEFGLLPHYVDYDQVKHWYINHSNVRMREINILNSDPRNVIREMLTCDAIISSSLHGVIVAHAYGIPAIWVRHSDKLNGDGTKFHDYFESVGLQAECIEMRERIEPDELRKLNFQVGININLNPMKAALQGFLNELPNNN